MAPSQSETRISQGKGDHKEAIGLWRLPEMNGLQSNPLLVTMQVMPFKRDKYIPDIYALVEPPPLLDISTIPVFKIRKARSTPPSRSPPAPPPDPQPPAPATDPGPHMIPDSEAGTTFEIQLFYGQWPTSTSDDDCGFVQSAAVTDMEMKLRPEEGTRIMSPPPSGSGQKLIQQSHDHPNTDLNLITSVDDELILRPDGMRIMSPPSSGPSHITLNLTTSDDDSGFVQSAAVTDMEMKWRHEEGTRIMSPPPSGFGHKLIEQSHDHPNTDLNLITAAYLSMNGDNFNVPHWVEQGLPHPHNAIYKQRTLLANTVLHIAARYGDNRLVEKVAHDAPYLFNAFNSNYDTALHVAAREGHESTVQSLLNSYLTIVRRQTNYYPECFKPIAERMLMLGLTLFRNDQENTFLHEAFMVNSDNGSTILQAFEASLIGNDVEFKEIAYFLAVFATNKEGKSLLYLAIEAGCKPVVNQLLDYCDRLELLPHGNSPLLPAIINRDKDMLEMIVNKKPNWIHLTDAQREFPPLHYAASKGFLDGVSYLTNKCASCTMEKDKDGFFPIHLASREGHVEVVQELLKWCPDPTEMLDQKNGRNCLHMAAQNGKYKVVRYILQHPKLEKMLNQKDKNGDTPLHLATRNWHPKVVHAFTWDKRVNLALLNKRRKTALDIAEKSQSKNPSLSQRLTWIALESADAPRSSVVGLTPLKEAPKIEQYKDRVDTLMVVSTLIITASFAAGFTIPGDVEDGTAVDINRYMFHLFIFSITFSLYGSIGTTIILIWARLGDLHLTYYAIKYVMPLLGITLGSLSLAFLGGVYLVVSKVNWLGTAFLVMGVILVVMVMLAYSLLWLPSTSTSPIIRYISYYPFLVLASLVEAHTTPNEKPKPPRIGRAKVCCLPLKIFKFLNM